MIRCLNKRRSIIEEAYRILDDFRTMQNGEICEVAYCDFIRSYNKVCRDFFGNYYSKEKMKSLKKKPPRINKLVGKFIRL